MWAHAPCLCKKTSELFLKKKDYVSFHKDKESSLHAILSYLKL